MYSENINRIKNYFSRLAVIHIASGVVFFMGCDFKPPAMGEVEYIIAIAEDTDWNYTANVVKEVFEQTVITPQDEKSYTVVHPLLESIKIYSKYHNILVLVSLESKGVVRNLLNAILTPDERENVEAGLQFAIQKKNVWASDQHVLILVAPTIQELLLNISGNSQMLYRMVDKEAKEMLKAIMYKREEQVEISKQLYEKYGFTFRVQHDYHMKEWPEQHAVFFRRMDPDRMIFIYWMDTTDVGYIPESWVIQKRNEMAEPFLDGRNLQVDYSEFSRSEFADYTALEIRGLWLQPEQFIGGPLINYTFFDETTSRIYMIDLSLFAPEYINEKVPFLKQLDIIANTFTTNPRNLPF